MCVEQRDNLEGSPDVQENRSDISYVAPSIERTNRLVEVTGQVIVTGAQ